MTDYGDESEKKPNFTPIEQKKKSIAVAIKGEGEKGLTPQITAAARGALADKILQMAFENGIKVRTDSDLAEMLAELELDSPVPTEALMAVAEILSYVYRANGEPDPFNAILSESEDNTPDGH